MGGIRIHCQLVGQTKCVRVIDIPDDISFKDLHDCLTLSFGLDWDGVHAFTAGEIEVPVAAEDNQALQENREADLCPVNVFRAGEPVHYYCETEEYHYEILIRKKQMKPSFKKAYCVAVEASDVPPGARLSFCDSGGNPKDAEPSAKETGKGRKGTTQTILQAVNAALLESPPERAASLSPDLEELADEGLRQIDNIMKAKGLDTRSLFDRMDQQDFGAPPLPAPPKAEKGRGALYRNLDAARDWAKSHPGSNVRMEAGGKTILEILSGLDHLGLYDYCKYLQLIDKLSLPKPEKLQSIRDAYDKEPELLLYPLSEEETEALTACFSPEARPGSCRAESLPDFILTGIAEFSREKETLYLASDLADLLSRLSPSKIRKTRKLIAAFEREFRILMRHYGILEIDAVQERLNAVFSTSIPARQCKRLIYWRFSLLGLVVTFTNMHTHVPYCSLEGLDLESIMGKLDPFGMFITYAGISDYELKQWEKGGDYMDAFAGWAYLYGFLVFNGGMKKEEAREHCDDIYLKVRNGAKLKDCMEMLGVSHGSNAQMAVRMLIWEICLHFLAGTSLPSLKGEKPAIACRDSAYSLCPDAYFAGKTVSEGKIEKLTHVEDMPTSLQMEFGARLFTLEESDLPPLRKAQRRFDGNADILFILGTAYQRLGHFKEALSCFERVDRLLEGGDASVREMIQACRNGHSIRPVSIYEDGFVFL